ncbi:hypothetical protein H4R24_000335 [Coemansia sp. RSA 988]|nr:hypothetical protein H4R24_000335 [Coemansia sp. RSA 988]
MAMFGRNIKSPSVLQHAVRDLMDELSLEMLSKFRNLIIHLEVVRNLSEYQKHIVLNFNKKHLAAELQCGDRYTLERDDIADAPEPLTGTYKTQHLIPVDKATRLPDDMYKVDFIHDHRLQAGKAPLYLVRWCSYTAQHDTWELATNFDDPSLVAAYQTTKTPVVQAQLQEATQWATRQATNCHAASKTRGNVVGTSHG